MIEIKVINGYKKCSKCKNDKSVEEFDKSSINKSGLTSQCKTCRHSHYELIREDASEYWKEYYKEHKEEKQLYLKSYWEKNKEKLLAKKKEYYYDNRDIILDNIKSYENKLKVEKPEIFLLNRVRHNAKQRGLDFNLTIDDIVIPEKCPIFNIPLFFTEGKRTDNTPSVDRVDNTKGYVKGNISIISWKANNFKKNFTLEDFKNMVLFLERFKNG